MHWASGMPIWAVHISDGILTWPWLAGGFVLAGLLALLGAWRIREEEIAQVALLTAAFFVASLVHVRVPPTSVHLLLNGLVGVVLGRRAALAIPVGLFLQVVLIGHGGFTTLGVNSCVLVVPALLAWQTFALLQRVAWVRQTWFRAGLVATCTLAWTLSLVYSVALLFAGSSEATDWAWAGWFTLHPVVVALHPIVLAIALVLAGLAAWAERRLENAPEFPLGLLIGEMTVLVTTFLDCLVLTWGGQENWQTLALLLFVAHLPIAVVEGIILGFTVGFLVRVKPEMLGWIAQEKTECPVESLP